MGLILTMKNQMYLVAISDNDFQSGREGMDFQSGREGMDFQSGREGMDCQF